MRLHSLQAPKRKSSLCPICTMALISITSSFKNSTPSDMFINVLLLKSEEEFIEIYFIYHSIYPLKVYNSIVFSIFMGYVQPSPQSIIEHFHHAQRMHCTFSYFHPIPPFSPLWPQTTTNLLSLDSIACFGILSSQSFIVWLLHLGLQ